MMIDAIWQDLRYAVRALRRTPFLTVSAALTLALAFAAHAAVFSFVDAVLLRPLTYRDPGRLVVIHDHLRQVGSVPISAGEFEEWVRSTKSFDTMALLGFVPVNLTGTGNPERLDAARVSAGFFSMLGVSPAAGRLLARGDDVVGRHRVVVLGSSLWRRRFGADRSVVGRTVLLNGFPFTVVGVLPDGFRFPRLDHVLAMPIASGYPDLWLPFAITPQDREDSSFAAIARLKPATTTEQARTDVDAVQREIGRRFTPPLDLSANVIPLQAQITATTGRNLLFIWVGVAIVLVIASANIANLLVARASRRRHELALHVALGADTARIVRLTTLEGLVLAGIAVATSLAVSAVALPALIAVAPSDVPRLDEVAMDATTVAVAIAVALVCGLAIGIVPGVRAARASLTDAIRQQGAHGTGLRHDRRVLRVLVAMQVAATIVTVTSAALLARSFFNVLRTDRGFVSQEISTVDVAAAGARYQRREDRTTLVRTALERLQALPGVTSVGVVNKLPLTGVGMNSLIVAAGTEDAGIPLQARPLGDIRSVNADYFRTLGIPLLRGRLFETTDDGHSAAVVSAAAAARTWPDQDPIGRRFRLTADPERIFEVVGVVGNVRAFGLDATPPMSVYLPYADGFLGRMSFAFRLDGPPESIEPGIARALHGLDPDLAVSPLRPMSTIVDESVAPRQFEALVLLSFGGVALILAGIGIYSVLAFAVLQRTREIGVRLALGAAPSRIRWMILGDAAIMVAVGALAGAPLALWSGIGLRGLLFGVAPGDPATLAAATAILAVVAALGAYVPARRAATIDPIVSLRAE